LIVAGTWAVLAAICAVVIRARLKGMTGLRRTRESVQEDLAMLKRDEETPAPSAIEAG
jgi:Putative Actinobacterial Holin-X, holin superfamily III